MDGISVSLTPDPVTVTAGLLGGVAESAFLGINAVSGGLGARSGAGGGNGNFDIVFESGIKYALICDYAVT